MHEAEKLSLEGIRRFVEASEEIRFESENRQQRYSWVERVLVEHEYATQGKLARGLVRRYVEKMTGLSRAQTTRLIGRYASSGRVEAVVAYRRRRFLSARVLRIPPILFEVSSKFAVRSTPICILPKQGQPVAFDFVAETV